MTSVFIIAEIGSNWRMGTRKRDLSMARTLIGEAARAGADAVKFQSFSPETVYVKSAGRSAYLGRSGIDEPITEIFADLVLEPEMIPELAECASEEGVEFMSTPFSLADLEVVDPFVKRHKIASYEISHAPLIAAVARTGKPLILSTGAATLGDVDWAIGHFREHGGRDLTVLQCTASYPAPVDSLNLRTLPALAERFGVAVGLSDHSLDPVTAPVAAAALGASVIEKHFTLDKRLPGPDHSFAVTPSELKELVRSVRDCEIALGSGEKDVAPAERELHRFARRALQATKPIRKGDVLSAGVNLGILRPGTRPPGVHPRYLPELEGKRARRDIDEGDGVSLDDVEG